MRQSKLDNTINHIHLRKAKLTYIYTRCFERGEFIWSHFNYSIFEKSIQLSSKSKTKSTK